MQDKAGKKNQSPGKHRFPVIVPDELWEKLVDARWRLRKRSVNQLVNEILEKAISDGI